MILLDLYLVILVGCGGWFGGRLEWVYDLLGSFCGIWLVKLLYSENWDVIGGFFKILFFFISLRVFLVGIFCLVFGFVKVFIFVYFYLN